MSMDYSEYDQWEETQSQQGQEAEEETETRPGIENWRVTGGIVATPEDFGEDDTSWYPSSPPPGKKS